MKFSLRIWLFSALLEGVIYTFVALHLGIMVLPFALVGGIPGQVIFALLLEKIDTKIAIGRAKWLAIIAAQYACANGTLALFLFLFGIPFFGENFLYVWVLNLAVTLAFALSFKLAKKTYFTEETPLIDLDETENIFTFKQVTDEN